ncbi:hypothetical protein J2Y03_004157 [Neobacillus niacini]|nr:hypothetical protein [Neobacillus niacini]
MIEISSCSLLRTYESGNKDIEVITIYYINNNNKFALFRITFKNPIFNYALVVHFKEQGI